MKKFIYTTTLVLALLFTAAAGSEALAVPGTTNPFLTPPTQNSETDHQAESNVNSNTEAEVPSKRIAPVKAEHSGLYGTLLREIALWQKILRSSMARFAHKIHQDPLGKSFFLFLAFSFAYGVIHAIGPGHGKSVVCAYFMSRRGRPSSSLFLSLMITFVHVGSATLAVCGAYFLLKTGMSGFERFSDSMQTLSFSLLILIGCWLLISSIISLSKSLRSDTRKSEPEKCASVKEMTAVAFFTGIIPCPGAAIILVFTISSGILWAGLISMAVLATGMAVTTFLFAYLASRTRMAITCNKSESRINRAIPSVLSLSGAIIIIAFGALMLNA